MAVSKTRVELREAIRTQVDMDDEELPNATLDLYLDDAYEQTLAIQDRWPFLESSWTFVTNIAQNAYDLDDGLDQISSVIDVTDTRRVLSAISHDRAEAMFGQGDGDSSGVPAYWSVWGNQIVLWPTPTAGRTVNIRGFRQGAFAPEFDAVVDADARLHVPMMYYAIALVYAGQEDEVLEASYMSRWDSAVRRAHGKIMAAPSRRPIVLSGGGANIDRFRSFVLVP